MSTDDRDIESGNPSKSFSVGEFDRLSGFFTPVWESKRRLRAESPLAGSAAAARARPGTDSERGLAPPSAGAAAPAAAEAEPARARKSAPAAGAAPGSAPAAPGPRPLQDAAAAQLNPTGTLRGVAAPGAVRPGAPGSSLAAGASEATACGEAQSHPDSIGAAAAAAAAVTVRPVIPMPQTPGRAPARSKTPVPTGSAPAARRAPPSPDEGRSDQGRHLSAPGASSPWSRSWAQRSERAAAAARVVHHALETRRSSELSDETFPRHRETESERDAALFAAARAASMQADPHSSHVLRALRRTFHLSTPLPEPVLRMLDKYRR